MKSTASIIQFIAMILLFALLTSACEQQGPAERAGEKIDETVEKVGDSAEDAVDKVGDKLEEVGDKIEEKTESRN